MRRARAAMLVLALCTAATRSAFAQDLVVSDVTCIDRVVHGGQRARVIADFTARDGRIFTCSGEIMVPDSNDARPRIDETKCLLTRSAMPGGAKTSTAYVVYRGANPGVCVLDLTMQANLSTGKARFCAFRGSGELCKTFPLLDGAR